MEYAMRVMFTYQLILSKFVMEQFTQFLCATVPYVIPSGDEARRLHVRDGVICFPAPCEQQFWVECRLIIILHGYAYLQILCLSKYQFLYVPKFIQQSYLAFASIMIVFR